MEKEDNWLTLLSSTSQKEALKTILIVYAKLNPGVRYVQGMNEIVAPLFYVFRNDPDEENAVCMFASLLAMFYNALAVHWFNVLTG